MKKSAPETPLISIITVTLNPGILLEKTFDSIKSQDFKNWQWVVVDGGSNDHTNAWIKEHRKYIDQYMVEKDEGIFHAMNKAIKLCNGTYLIFLNAGDFFYSPYTLSKIFSDSRQAGVLYGNAWMVNNAGKKIAVRRRGVPKKLSFQKFRLGMPVCHQAFIVKKKYCIDFNLNYKLSADYDWMIKIVKNKKVKALNLKIPLVCYLMNGKSKQRHFKSLKERFIIMADHYGFFPAVFQHLFILLKRIYYFCLIKKYKT